MADQNFASNVATLFGGTANRFLVAAGASSVVSQQDASTARTTLGLGTLATQSPTGTPDGTKFLRDDFSWQTVTSGGGTPGGSTGQMQFNNAGSFGGAAAAVYSATGTHIAITATGATLIPLCVKGAASQSANLLEVQNSSGTVLSGVNSSGNYFVTAGGQIQSSATNYLRLNTFLTTLNSSGETELISDNSAGNSVRFGNNNGGLSLRGIACTVYAFAGTALQITSGAGSGTNGAAQPFRLRAGAGTGSAVPASLLLQTTTAGASGTTPQTHRSVAELDGNTTSGETPLLLLDCAKGTLQRVSIGASDSGGTGFKVLRVPN